MGDDQKKGQNADWTGTEERRSGKDRREIKEDRRGDDRVETELHPRRSGKDRRKS